MAVEKFKLLTLIASKDQFEEVVESTVIDSPFQVEDTSEVLKEISHKLTSYDERNPYDLLLRKCLELSSANDITLNYSEFKNKTFGLEEIKDFILHFEDDIITKKQRQIELLNQIGNNEKLLEKIKYIENADISLDELFNCKFIEFRFGRIPKEGYKIYQEKSWDDQNVFFFPTTTEEHYVYGMYFTTFEDKISVDSFFKSIHFERMWLPDEAHGKPKEAFLNITNENKKLKLEELYLTEKLKEKIQSNTETFLTYYSYLKYHHTIFDLKKYALKTEELFILCGWIPANSLEEFIEKIKGLDLKFAIGKENLIYLVKKPDKILNSIPPTKLSNKPIFQFYEQFVSMYGLPGYNEIDPTPILAITYTLLFGIMFGDVGQGFVLALVGFLLYKLKGMSFGKILMSIGASSFVFGFVYGSVFGNEHLIHGFGVMENGNNINITLISAVMLGVIIIITAIVMNILNGIKQKDLMKFVFSSNGIAGLVFYLSIIIGVLLLFGLHINVFSFIYILVFVIVPLVAIFLREPLNNILKKNKQKIHNKTEYFIENAFELVEVLLSYITNTVSFLRVGAFALNHVGMMLVVYILAGAQESAGNPIVLVLGNALVICLEGLIVGIQILRLEFYEIFSRFYSGNGKEYKPLKINYKIKNI